MWTYIKKDDFDRYINEHPSLEEFTQDFILLEANDAYFVPRLFAKNYSSKYLNVLTGVQEKFKPDIIDGIEFTGELRKEQEVILTDLANIYKKNGYINGIIKARPGLGKSVLSVYIATQLKIKTLVIVDNQNLMKQWIQSFLEFTNLKVEDIGIIRQSAFGVNKPIILGMAQTLLRKVKTNIQQNFKALDKAGIGLVIYDEVHATSSAPIFSKVSLLFRTKNILGLSATPFQTGIAEILMKNTVGEIISDSKNYDMKPEYRLLSYQSKLDRKKLYVLGKFSDYIQRKSFYNKIIIESMIYRKLILDQTREMLELGHRIIIICFTKKQVTTISEMLTDNGLENKMFYGGDREITYKEKILVATYAYAGKGFDYKKLSCLILACPLAGKKSLIQVIGRILRSDPDKLAPIVIDLADLSVPLFTIPEVRMKKKVITNEFECRIIERDLCNTY
jgi:superfamily II DNA or RNA helicase